MVKLLRYKDLFLRYYLRKDSVMPHYKKLLLLGVFLISCSFFLPEDANAAKKKQKDNAGEAPISVLADYIHYDNATGEIFAEGNVRVLQNGQTLSAARIDGNVNTADIWTKVVTRFEEPALGNDFTGDSATYNYNSRTGHIDNVKGKSGTEYITADNIEIMPDKSVAQNVSMSRCNAENHVKCQHTTATRVDIWPNDRMIAYNANVYILGKKVYHQDRYVVSMGAGEDKFFPHIGYNNDDGAYISHTVAFPLGNKTTIGADLFAGSKAGGRTDGWIRHDERNFNIRYSYGYDQDDDDDWVKKENNISIKYHQKRLFKTPLSYRFWFERGLWKERSIRSWHSELGAYLSHDPIYLGSKSFYFTMGTGYRKLKESYGDIDNDEFRYDFNLNKIFSAKFDVGVGYSVVDDYDNIFEYDSIDVTRSLTYFVNWSPTKQDKFTFWQQYDTERNRVYKNRITYTRRLHCWELVLGYERERYIDRKYDNKFKWEVHLAI